MEEEQETEGRGEGEVRGGSEGGACDEWRRLCRRRRSAAEIAVAQGMVRGAWWSSVVRMVLVRVRRMVRVVRLS